jgi:hypothetical protein
VIGRPASDLTLSTVFREFVSRDTTGFSVLVLSDGVKKGATVLDSCVTRRDNHRLNSRSGHEL